MLSAINHIHARRADKSKFVTLLPIFDSAALNA